ncbi:TPA: hypothetical protein DF272_00915 [Candidatus Falkowbacteria bacterium]|nr:hypothetical protein [Candidatus Falkowbacteria bacterium]
MNFDLSKIINLIKRTGDRYIINDGDDLFVLLPFSDYSDLIAEKKAKIGPVNNLSEEELLRKINSEIIQWKMTQPESTIQESFFQELDKKGLEESSEEQYYLEPID